MKISRRTIAELIASIVSGLFLFIAFPPAGESQFAWFALAPLFIVARNAASGRRAFWLGLICGSVFWVGDIFWLTKLADNGGPVALVFLGLFGLSAYCALYFGLFSLFVNIMSKRLGSRFEVAEKLRERQLAASMKERGLTECDEDFEYFQPKAFPVRYDLALAVFAMLCWVGLELVRSKFCTGFAWNHLGVSQFRNHSIIQVAELGGVYAVSAVLMLMNALLANVGARMWRTIRRRPVPRHQWDLLIGLAVVFLVFTWSVSRARELRPVAATSPNRAVIGVVQPDAPSFFERGDQDKISDVNARLMELTERLGMFKPAFVVWPETALPDVMPREGTREFAVAAARLANAPLIAGAVEVANSGDQENPIVANSSWMFLPEGVIPPHYRKQHLVPFGEYVPLDKTFPILQQLSPVGYSCTPGRTVGKFLVPVHDEVSGRERYIIASPLICFEDTVSDLSRHAVKSGAQILVNQSNDAWFSGSSEGWQHHAQAVFRAVENRVPMVRAANRGVSTVISIAGVSTEPSDSFALPVSLRSLDAPQTVYTRYGDLAFAIPCAILALFALCFLFARKNRDGSAEAALRGHLSC